MPTGDGRDGAIAGDLRDPIDPSFGARRRHRDNGTADSQAGDGLERPAEHRLAGHGDECLGGVGTEAGAASTGGDHHVDGRGRHDLLRGVGAGAGDLPNMASSGGRLDGCHAAVATPL